MKKLILFLCILSVFCGKIFASTTNETATITITNAPTGTNGESITFQGLNYVWTNTSPIIGQLQISTNGISGDTTNLFSQLSNDWSAGGLIFSFAGTNEIQIRTYPNIYLAISNSAGWMTSLLVTNIVGAGNATSLTESNFNATGSFTLNGTNLNTLFAPYGSGGTNGAAALGNTTAANMTNAANSFTGTFNGNATTTTIANTLASIAGIPSGNLPATVYSHAGYILLDSNSQLNPANLTSGTAAISITGGAAFATNSVTNVMVNFSGSATGAVVVANNSATLTIGSSNATPLTATSIAAAGGVTNQTSVPLLLGTLPIALYDGSSFMALTNGASITNSTGTNVWLPSYGSNLNLIMAGNPKFAPDGVAGLPAVSLEGTSSYLIFTNLFVNFPQLTNYMTLVIVFRCNDENQPSSCLWCSAIGLGQTGAFETLRPYGGTSTGGKNAYMALNTIGGGADYYQYGQYGNQNNTYVFTVASNNAVFITFNGKVSNDSAQNSAGAGYGAVKLLGNLYVGFESYYQSEWLNANIAFIGIYPTNLNQSALATLNDYLTTKYHRRRNNIVLDGDSIMAGWDNQTAADSPINQIAAQVGKQFDIDGVMQAGQTTSQRLIEATNWANTIHSEAMNNICVDWVSGVNDYNASLTVANTETNYLLKAALLHTSHWKYVPTTLISSQVTDASGNRTNINNWLYANWTNFADGLITLDKISSLGTNGAYSNAVYFADLATHPTDAGYLLTTSNFLAGIYIASSLGGITTNIQIIDTTVLGATVTNTQHFIGGFLQSYTSP